MSTDFEKYPLKYEQTDTGIPLFFSEIQYTPVLLETIPLDTIMRVEACILQIHLSFTTGEFTVTVELSTQITRVVQEVAINVAPEGSLFHRHTSVLLDLKARANVLR